MSIDRPVSGAAGGPPATPAVPAPPEAPAFPPAAPVAGGAAAPRPPASPAAGRGASECEALKRDAQDFAALMEGAPEPTAAKPASAEQETASSLSAMVSQAMAAYRAPQESELAAAPAATQPADGSRLENTIATVAGIERLVEQILVSQPADAAPVVVLRLADDVLAGAEVRLEIAGGTLKVAFSSMVPGTNPLLNLDFLLLGDKLVDCAGVRDVELTVDCGETGAVETWRFPRDGSSRNRRGRKESDHQ